MRRTRCMSVGVLTLLLGGPALADEKDFVPYTATVVQTTADVRCGPGERMYVTNRLGRVSEGGEPLEGVRGPAEIRSAIDSLPRGVPVASNGRRPEG